MDRTDEELLRAYNSGETAAFDTLFQNHKGRIFNFALRYLDNRSEAEDVTSEVFVQLFQNRFKYDGRATLSTWLFTVARNNCLSRLRSGKKRGSFWFQTKSGDQKEMDIPDTEESPTQALEQKEATRAVRQALRRLPAEQKEALLLREYARKDYTTIAAILNCSLEKVKILIFRGRENLRKQLGATLKEDGQ